MGEESKGKQAREAREELTNRKGMAAKKRERRQSRERGVVREGEGGAVVVPRNLRLRRSYSCGLSLIGCWAVRPRSMVQVSSCTSSVQPIILKPLAWLFQERPI